MALVEGTNCGFVLAAPSADPAGGELGTQDGYAAACKFVAPVGASAITEIGWYCHDADDAANFEVGLYAHDAGNNRPGNLLASSGNVAKGTTAGWKAGTVTVAVVAGTTYWIATQCDETASGCNMDYTTNVAYTRDYKSAATTLPSPWGESDGSATRLLSYYAVYTTAAGGATVIIATPESLGLRSMKGLF
jgi:hypothetical protein